MKLYFYGAAHEVTGSCTLLDTGSHRILIDCGMEQGADIYENAALPLSPVDIDCVLLTHAHIDHSGRLPLLVAGGFKGPIYTTAAAERGNQTYEFYHIGPVTGQLIGNLVGLLLIGAAFIALGAFISALTENQLAAAVITISVIALMLGLGLVNSLIDIYWIRAVLSWISIYSRFGNFQNGLFDFASILYYASICFVFVFLTVRVYEKRRWN